jgi:hypothetical protein
VDKELDTHAAPAVTFKATEPPERAELLRLGVEMALGGGEETISPTAPPVLYSSDGGSHGR